MNEKLEQPEPDGERWLRIIGRSHYATQYMKLKDGTTVKGADFPTVCSTHAIEMFKGIDDMDPTDPDYPESIELAQSYLDGHMGDQIKSE